MQQPARVWVVVERSDYHGVEVVAVWDDEPAARTFAQHLTTERSHRLGPPDWIEVEEWIVNQPDPEREDH